MLSRDAYALAVLAQAHSVCKYLLQVRTSRRQLASVFRRQLDRCLSYEVFRIFGRYVMGDPSRCRRLIVPGGCSGSRHGMSCSKTLHQVMHGDGTKVLDLVVVVGAGIACLVALALAPGSATSFIWQAQVAALTSPMYPSSRPSRREHAPWWGVFPLFLLLGRAGRNATVHQAIVILFFILQGLWLWRFVTGEWVGIKRSLRLKKVAVLAASGLRPRRVLASSPHLSPSSLQEQRAAPLLLPCAGRLCSFLLRAAARMAGKMVLPALFAAAECRVAVGHGDSSWGLSAPVR